MAQNTYSPPTGKEIAKRQDEIDSLRPLLAQRKLYSRAKYWLSLRLMGMGGIAFLAPIIAFIWPQSAVIVGAVSGAWIFLGRTVFSTLEKGLSAKAAAVQEMFDVRVFKMPHFADRTSVPTLEEIAVLTGADNTIDKQAKDEKLLAWYAVNPSDSGTTTVAICQRINTSYSKSLLNTTSKVWLGLIIFWSLTLVSISIYLQLSLNTFILAVMLPLLPAFLDEWEFRKGFKKAENQRDSMTQEIESKINSNSVNSSDLLVWQSRMYDLRRDMPLVPDKVYGFMRNINEKAMKVAARQLSDKSRGN
ncbi:hypothetical protein HGA88_00595 [Candidatus Roizmanbacteria bacterium]|nr:hypothetical protein [Candidatus Roizmanbacteria bacterium]